MENPKRLKTSHDFAHAGEAKDANDETTDLLKNYWHRFYAAGSRRAHNGGACSRLFATLWVLLAFRFMDKWLKQYKAYRYTFRDSEHSGGRGASLQFRTSDNQERALINHSDPRSMNTATQAQAPRPKILLMGDSLTQLGFEGWAATLANVYQRRADVLNRGYSGYNTKYYLQLSVESLNQVVLVVIFFGANDAALQEQDAHHHVPLGDYQNNLRRLVDRARQYTTNIILIAPPPVHHQQRLDYQKQRFADKATGVLERTLEHTGLYAKACCEVARELDIPAIDMYHDMIESTSDFGIYLNDGLHFSAQGHEFVAIRVLQAIKTHFPDLHVEQDATTGQWCNSSSKCQALSSQGPYHDEIDHKNVAAAFGKE